MAGGDESIYAPSVTRSEPPAGSVTIEKTAEPSDRGSDFALPSGLYWHLKRPAGFVAAMIALALALPVLIVVSLVLANQGRPVLIRRKRLGLHGKPFTCYYFRTMPPDSLRAIDQGAHHKSVPSDSFGRMLARTRLDRLPLIFNVLRGDMNLVGPRPLTQEELIGSGRSARHSLSIRPGLTGLWWVEGENDLRRRLALDRSYIEHASVSLDVRIFLRTVVLMHRT